MLQQYRDYLRTRNRTRKPLKQKAAGFLPTIKVRMSKNDVNVYKQETSLYVVVSVCQLVQIWNLPQFPAGLFLKGQLTLHSFFLYKNIFYKNIEAEICEIIRIF